MAAADGSLDAWVNREQGKQPEYEFEDPIESWIDLVEAAHISDAKKRLAQVTFFLNVAKNSHWTHKLMEAQLEQDADVDYTGQDDLAGGHGGTYGQQDTAETIGESDLEEGFVEM